MFVSSDSSILFFFSFFFDFDFIISFIFDKYKNNYDYFWSQIIN